MGTPIPARALSPLAVQQAAQNLLDCVCAALDRVPLDVPGLHGCPCRKGVVPGAPAADGCDEGCTAPGPGEYPGQLTVNVVRIYSTTRDRFPVFAPSSPDSVRNLKNCLPPIVAVDLNVTLWRCAPGPTDQGCPPSMEDLNEAATQLHVDALAIQQGILCCYAGSDSGAYKGRRYTIGQTLTLGPQGGCVGLETGVTVALDDPLCCPPTGP